MAGELGDDTYIDVLLQSSALFLPNFTSIGNDEVYATLIWTSWCFLLVFSFRGHLGEISSRKNKALRLFMHVFSLHVQCNVRGGGSHFQFSSPNS